MVRAALVGVGIALIGLIIPVVHFVTGPLGPLAGGFFAGQSLDTPDEMQAIGIGVLMGVFLGLIALPFALGVFIFADVPTIVLLIPAMVLAYVALLGSVGALVGVMRAKSAKGA